MASLVITLRMDVPHSFLCAYVGGMSTKHNRTVADLVRFGCGLKVDCLACGGGKTFADGVDAAKAGVNGELCKLAGKLRCSRCGAKEARWTVLPPI